jgi:hypothetical protein
MKTVTIDEATTLAEEYSELEKVILNVVLPATVREPAQRRYIELQGLTLSVPIPCIICKQSTPYETTVMNVACWERQPRSICGKHIPK